MLVLVEDQRLLLATGDLDGDDFVVEDAVCLGLGGLFLGAQGEQVLVFTGDLELLGDVLRSLRHGVDAVLLLHQRVDEAPADGGVFDLLATGEGTVGLAHDVGCAGHGFHTASQHQVHFTGADGAEGGADRVHTGAAQAVDGGARNSSRQSGQQGGHARHVAVVFTGLVGTTHDHFFDRFGVELGGLGQYCFEDPGGQVVGAHTGQGAAKTADGRALGVADEYVCHVGSSVTGVVGFGAGLELA